MPLDSGDLRRRSSPAAGVEKAGERCPRCESRDTKFCYYNNYNTGQPRHFCRACRRYWTLGGALRNVPIGGSSRKRPRHAFPGVEPVSRPEIPAVELHSRRTGPGLGLAPWLSGPPRTLLALGDLGLRLGLNSMPGGPQEEELGFGLGPGLVWPPALLEGEDGGIPETWRMQSGESECFAAVPSVAAWAGPAQGKGGAHTGLQGLVRECIEP